MVVVVRYISLKLPTLDMLTRLESLDSQGFDIHFGLMLVMLIHEGKLFRYGYRYFQSKYHRANFDSRTEWEENGDVWIGRVVATLTVRDKNENENAIGVSM